MYTGGDDLSQPRIIDFCFIFDDRRHALVFAGAIEDQESEVCISYYREREMWQVVVKHCMIPDHAGITALETALASKAQAAGGRADGWGCMQVHQQ